MKIKIPHIKKNYKKKDFKFTPNIYWKIIVILFLLLIMIIAVFAFNLFKETIREDLQIESITSRVEKEKKEKIDNVLEYFSEREQKSNTILNSPSPVVDPSL